MVASDSCDTGQYSDDIEELRAIIKHASSDDLDATIKTSVYYSFEWQSQGLGSIIRRGSFLALQTLSQTEEANPFSNHAL